MLKSLELFGFKSFADRTRFDFSEGITCVVGPNGSGKSNVVDAMKWILGDQSPKSLRGKEMTDVIFNGAAGRKPSGYAEATLTFDNSQGLLPVDTSEVQIGRRLWRNGDSEYLINRGSARLKDIKDLFMGTGATTSAYSIIEQGRVDQILQANATARRNVFEEAAGISRFKARKTEALRKLERVAQNLLRLTDIVDEVESQLNSTRQQAVKATKYREASEELRTLWFGLAADDYRHYSAKLNEVEQAMAESGARIEALSRQQQSLEERLGSFDAGLAGVDERLREVERDVTTHREAIAGDEATIRHLRSTRHELENELGRLRRQRVLMASRYRAIQLELVQTEQSVEQFQAEVARQGESLAGHERVVEQQLAALNEARRADEQGKARVTELIQAINNHQHALANIHSKQEAIQGEIGRLADRQQELQQLIAACEQECQSRDEALQQATRQHEAAAASVQSAQEQVRELHEEQATAQQRIAEARERRSGGEARRAVLEDLERRHEGMGIGVKEILSRADTSNYPPWNRIIGTVADLLEAELEDAPLLEIALGNRAQLIVLEDRGPLVDYLNRAAARVSGRVGFLFLSELKSTNATAAPADVPRLSGEPGVLMRADALVSGVPHVPGLAAALLSETWIVNTLDDAYRLSEMTGRTCRFVTLQGELLDRDRTLYVGTVNGDAALVSRKSELRKLKNELLRLDDQVAEDERRLAALQASQAELQSQLAEVELQRQEAHDVLTSARSQLDVQHSERQRLRQLESDLLREYSELEVRRNELAQELTTAQATLAAAEAALEQARAGTVEAAQAVETLQAELQETQQRHQEERLAFAKQEERLASLKDKRDRLQAEGQQRSAQREEAVRRFTNLEARYQRIVLQTLEITSHLAELALEQQRLATAADGLLAEKRRFRQQRSEFAREEATVRQERRQLKEEQHNHEIQARDIRHQITSLEQRIEEEYQLSLSDIIATGASAYAEYLRGQAGTGQATTASSYEEEPNLDADQVSLGEHSGMEESADVHDAPDVGESRDETREGEPDRPLETVAGETGEASDPPVPYEEIRETLEAQVNRLRRRLKTMGSVNTDSLDKLDELESRYRHLSDQLQDLVQAKTTLEEIVRRINTESKRLFIESFETIRKHFQELFRKLFGGGEGDAILEDMDDVLECGIDIVARPPGKELRSITLLSGGEKTMTAVALLLAIFKSRPSPFCILDEVDAALDEANVERYSNVLRDFQETTQFIIITHSKRTMTVADVLYGVTMEQSGVSKRMAVRFEDVSEDGHIRADVDQGGSGGAVSTAA